MKTLFTLAVGAAIAGTLVVLSRRSSAEGMRQTEADGPVESLEDSAGTSASATPLENQPTTQTVENPLTQGF